MQNSNAAELLHIYNETLVYDTEIDVNTLQKQGEFLKKIIIFLHTADNTTAHLELLTKMLAGCQLTIQDTYIIVAEEKQLMQLINHYRPQKTILFGFTLSNTSFHINRPLNKPFRYAGNAYLLTHTLADISNQVQLKSTLWTSGLKPFFGIK
jgi:hypothetical protein